MQRHSQYYVYIIRDKNGSFYTGYTSNLQKRLAQHERGAGSKYLKGRQPFELVFVKEYKYYKNALHAERKIKSYTRERKSSLIEIYQRTKNAPNQ